MTDREVYRELVKCPHFKIVTRILKQLGSNETKGWCCVVNTDLGSEQKIKKVADWCHQMDLPVTVWDEGVDKHFKIYLNVPA